MKIGVTGCAIAAIALGAGAATNELDVARQALRDGLFAVARTHAGRAAGDEARRIVLETYAREEDWKGLLSAVDAMGYPSGEDFVHYRALALFKSGSVEAASNLVFGTAFRSVSLAGPVARLRASVLLDAGDASAAIALLEKDGGGDVATRLMLASAYMRSGKPDSAAGLWRLVAQDKTADERSQAIAADGLHDVERLRALSATAGAASVRRFVRMSLGMHLLRDDRTFAEGERLVRETVRDKPDAEGAKESFLALADALLEKDRFDDAAKTYGDALSIWPETANEASLHSGLGRALAKAGRFGDAVAAFARAEELSSDASAKAVAALDAANAYVACGRESDATASYQRILSRYPGTLPATRVAEVVRLRETEELGRRFYREHKFDKAGQTFESLARENAGRGERMTYYRVLCAYGSGDETFAEETARKLAEGAKDGRVRADAALWLAKLAFNRRNWRDAERLFGRYVALCPDSEEAPRSLVWSARAALADNDFRLVISNVVKLVADYPDSPVRAQGMLVQGEALIELARFDEAVLVLERAASTPGVSDEDRLAARLLRADALFAVGADNPARYEAALASYRAIRTGEALSPADELLVSFKIARTLEKLGRHDEAVDMYYTQVVLAYRTGRIAGTVYDDAARATFSRAAFRLADEFERRGWVHQAVHVLELVRTSDVQASSEASSRIERINREGLLP